MYSNFDELTGDCLMHYQRKGAKWGQHKFGEWQEQAGYADGRPDPNAKVKGGQILNVKIGIPTARQQLALHERAKGQMGQPLANGTQVQRGLVNGRVAPPMPAGTPTPSDFIYRRFNGSKLPSFGNGTTLQTSSGSTSSSSDTKKKEEEKPTSSSSTTTTTTTTTTTSGGGGGGSSSSGSGGSSGGSSTRSSGSGGSSGGSSRRSSGSSAQQQTQQQPEVNEATLFRSDSAPNQKAANPNGRQIQNARVQTSMPTQRGLQSGRVQSTMPTQRGLQSGIVGQSNASKRELQSEITKKTNGSIDQAAENLDKAKVRSRALRGNKTFANDLGKAVVRSRELRKTLGKSGIDSALERLENAKKSNESKRKYSDVIKKPRKALRSSIVQRSMKMSDTTKAFDYLAHSYLED